LFIATKILVLSDVVVVVKSFQFVAYFRNWWKMVCYCIFFQL